MTALRYGPRDPAARAGVTSFEVVLMWGAHACRLVAVALKYALMDEAYLVRCHDALNTAHTHDTG